MSSVIIFIYLFMQEEIKMTLWDKLNEIANENENIIEVKLVVNHLNITDWINYHVFELYVTADLLALEEDEYTLEEFYTEYSDKTTRYFRITDKQEIINIVRNQYDTYKQRKEAIAKCDEEMAKCQALLDKLGINDKPAKENDEIIALQKEVNELKNIIRKANQMVPPPMKEMLPQDMKNAMDKVGQ